MRKIVAFAVLFLAVGALGRTGPATADDKPSDKNKEAVTDQQFVMKASAAGLAEVNLGKLAATRASNADVKKFGQHMVDDHTKANKELATIADKKKLTVAMTMDPTHEQAFAKLSKLEGAEFDKQFMHQMVQDHEEAVSLFSAKAKDAKDEDLKAFAEKTLPTLKEHLKMARETHDKVKGGR